MNPQRLIDRRHKLGLTQQQVADAAGIQRADYSRYETGKREPMVSTLEKIAEALKTTVAKLLE